MLTDTSAIRTYFGKLGLEHEIADIYLALHAEGPQSIAALARSSGVERTRIYRLIDTLLESNLIEVETRASRGVIKAAPITNLHILINQREQELKSLQDELGLIEQVLARNSLSNPTTRIQFYTGLRGRKQMVHHALHATSEVLSLSHRKVHSGIPDSGRIITNSSSASSGAVVRHIAPSVFRIAQDCLIYDDRIAYYSVKDDQLFGIEIHDKGTAALQRQFFELLWEKAGSIPDTSSR